MKIKNIIFLSGAALLLSTSAWATVINYAMTNPGTKVCTVKPASMSALCANFHPSFPSANTEFKYNTFTKILTTIEPGSKKFYWTFENNIFNTKKCWAFETSEKEPLSYCQNPSNNYLWVIVAAKRNSSSGAIHYDGTIKTNLPIAGYVIKAKILDAKLSPEIQN